MDQAARQFLVTQAVATPIGDLTLIADGNLLCMAEFADCAERTGRWLEKRVRPARTALVDGEVPKRILRAFDAYFAGDLAAIDGIAVKFSGTPFQNEVWAALRAIPAGGTFGYGAFAARLGRPQAARAVGHANGSNPLAVVVPCHRLVGAGGALTDYGGGLWRKRWLLEHEMLRAGGARPQS